MDLAYAHIPETAHDQGQADSAGSAKPDQQQAPAPSSLESDLQDAYKAISSSAWGMKIGGFFGNVVKQVTSPGCLVRDVL